MPFACDRKKVLLVDDEESIRKLFRMIVSQELPGCQVDMAGNGLEALEAFSKGHHAVLLMDLHMPVMDGPSAFGEIERLCSVRDWEMPSVVFCTGFAPPDSVMSVVQANQAHGLLLKPVTSEVLVATIQTRLKAGRGG
jgi:CheY-like chemotaxis protein